MALVEVKKMKLLVLIGLILVVNVCIASADHPVPSVKDTYHFSGKIRIANVNAGTYHAFIGNDSVLFQNDIFIQNNVTLVSNHAYYSPILLYTQNGTFQVSFVEMNRSFSVNFSDMNPQEKKKDGGLNIKSEDIITGGGITIGSAVMYLINKRRI